MPKPYDANLVAEHIINSALKLGHPLSNLHLQKILYFLQARFLIENSVPLYNNPIEKWKFGPVVPDVYYKYDYYGANPIEEIPAEIDFEELFVNKEDAISDWIETETIDREDMEIINETVNELIKYEPFELVNLTHTHPAWKEAEGQILSGVRHLQYTNQEILTDFNNNNFRIWRKS